MSEIVSETADDLESTADSGVDLGMFAGLLSPKDRELKETFRNSAVSSDSNIPASTTTDVSVAESTGNLSTPQSSTWLKAVAIVDFDVKQGQKVSVMVPDDACTTEVKKRVALLSLPDSYSGHAGNMLFSFRVRTNPELYTQSTEKRSYLYGHAFFSRERDSTVSRGFRQRSVVFLTEKPYAALYRTLADVTGPLFFEIGEEVLKTIVCDVGNWPAAFPGRKMSLPVAGIVLSYRIPFLHWDRNKLLEPTIKQSAAMTMSPAVKSIYDVFSISGQDYNGLFQSIGLYSTFGPSLAPSLWQVWELLMCGESLMVYAPTPDLCSRAVFSLVSLLGPFPFSGDFRPYFTIYDSDFETLADLFGTNKAGAPCATRGAMIPPLIIGVTNPFFLKSFENFPNILSLGDGPNNVHTFKKWVKPTLSGRSKILQQVSESSAKPYFLVSKMPVLVSNSEVLRQLLPVSSHSIIDHKDGAVGRESNSVSIPCVFERWDEKSNACDGKAGIGASPQDAINNALLRQHFRALTEQFLRPFEQLFGVTAKRGSGGASGENSVVLGFGPYMSESLYLVKFDRQSFMKRIKSNGMPRGFQVFGMKSKWVTIYDRFIDSPSFAPWFRHKQRVNRMQIVDSMKQLRMDTRAKDLVKSLAPTLYDMVRAQNGGKKSVPKREIDSLVHTLRIIKNEIESEEDKVLLHKMWEHYLAVNAILPDRFAPPECIQFSKKHAATLAQLSPKRAPKAAPSKEVPRQRLEVV
jgi:hypothetical protein